MNKMLIVQIPQELHAEIKALSAYRNVTIRQFVIRALLEKIDKEKEFRS